MLKVNSPTQIILKFNDNEITCSMFNKRFVDENTEENILVFMTILR